MNSVRLNARQIMAASLILLGAAGCSRNRSVNMAVPAIPGGAPKIMAHRQVISNAKLRHLLSVDYLNTDRVGNLIRVQARLTNHTSKTLAIEYRFEWLDDKGMLVPTPASRWIIRHLGGGETIFISAVAPSPKVADFLLKFRRR